MAAGAHARPRAGQRGPMVPVALRQLFRAAGSGRGGGNRRRATGVHQRTQPRPAVPPRGDAPDHGRMGPRVPARAQGRGCRPGRPARGDAPSRRRCAPPHVAIVRPLPRHDREAARMIAAADTRTFPRFLDLEYPSIRGGRGVWLETTDGRRILDACSGGAMVTSLGHGATEVIDAGVHQAEKIAYFYMDHFTNEPMERLAERLIATAAPEMSRVRFTSSGSEANETALRLARAYHFDRGEHGRWRVI